MALAQPASCPKCGTASATGAGACPTCGLASARMAGFAANLEAEVPEVVHTAWAAAREGWEDPATHDELLRLVTLHGCYAWAAWQYREARGEGGEPIADRQLERMRRAAEVALLTTAGPRPEGRTPYRSSMLALALIALLILVGLFYAKISTPSGGPTPSAGPGKSPTTPTPAPTKATPRPTNPTPTPPPAQMR